MTNLYCEALGIDVPKLESVKDHREASPYSLMIVALMEHGGPMTLEEVADRFERAGKGPADLMLRSLKRCRPGRSPVYRDEDHYALDPHDDEADLWAFRLGLRPPKVPRREAPPAPEPLPGKEVTLTPEELEEALRDDYLSGWSAQRLALAVLDSHGGRLPAAEAVGVLDRITDHHHLKEESARHWRRGAPISVTEGGDWVLDRSHRALPSAREAVRKRLEIRRKYQRPSSSEMEAHQRRIAAVRKAKADELAGLRRVLVHAFPAKSSSKSKGVLRAVVLVDVANRELATFVDEELEAARARLAAYDFICAVNVRPLLRDLGFDPGARRLAELGPPQKTRKLNRRGRALKITTTLLIQGSCGISRPFGDEAKLWKYLREGQTTRLHRRLEADAKSLFALYQYGRTQGAVRLLWGFLDERIPVPWVHREEPFIYTLLQRAFESGSELEVVVGSAPGWSDPWARSISCAVVRDGYNYYLLDEDGMPVDERDVQLARVVSARP